MKRILIVAAALLLSACSSFKLGGMVYCPFGQACMFQSVPAAAPAPVVPTVVPPEKSA